MTALSCGLCSEGPIFILKTLLLFCLLIFTYTHDTTSWNFKTSSIYHSYFAVEFFFHQCRTYGKTKFILLLPQDIYKSARKITRSSGIDRIPHCITMFLFSLLQKLKSYVMEWILETKTEIPFLEIYYYYWLFFSCPALKMSVSISQIKCVITAITNLPYTGEQLPSGLSCVGHTNISLRLLQSSYTRN